MLVTACCDPVFGEPKHTQYTGAQLAQVLHSGDIQALHRRLNTLCSDALPKAAWLASAPPIRDGAGAQALL